MKTNIFLFTLLIMSLLTPGDRLDFNSIKDEPLHMDNICINIEDDNVIKSSTPSFDYIIGDDNWPHFRVFYWVPQYIENTKPYCTMDINTDVSYHGAASDWVVVKSDIVKDGYSLHYIYVPKRFVMKRQYDFHEIIRLEACF